MIGLDDEVQAASVRRTAARYPLHGWAGIVLALCGWSLNWGLDGLRTHVFFFPMWLGYALAVDGLVFTRRGESPVARSGQEFAWLFVASVPVWWLFELFNLRTNNWTYNGAEVFSDLAYVVLASVAFSTVMPAVFVTAELVRSFGWVDRMSSGPRIPRSWLTATGFFVAGWVLVALIMIWPDVFYPFVWGSMFCLIEPLNIWLGRPSLFDHLDRRNWRPVVSVALGALICGFFWEFWNFYSFPKWTYRTPGAQFLHVFEMPLLGYIGYLPFGLELLAVGYLLRGKALNVNIT